MKALHLEKQTSLSKTYDARFSSYHLTSFSS